MRHVYAVLAALPCAATAVVFLITWISPGALGESMVSDLLCLMMMEFVLMHASVFMGAMPLLAKSRRAKIIIVLAFTAVYSTFAIGMPLSWGKPWLIGEFGALVAAKIVAVWHLRGRDQTMVQILSWGAAIFLVIFFVVCAWVVPFPRLGIEAEYVRPPGGDKFPNPHRIVAAGVLYWAAHAVVQFLIQRKMRPATTVLDGPDYSPPEPAELSSAASRRSI